MRVRSIHVSDIRTYKQCRVKWYYTSLLRLNLQPKHTQIAMWGGGLGHVGLEGLYDADPMSLESCLSAYDQWTEQELETKKYADNYDKRRTLVATSTLKVQLMDMCSVKTESIGS